MDKSTFMAALRTARLLQNAFAMDKGIAEDMYLALYEKLKGEQGEDVLYALEKLGESKERINLASIQEHVRMCCSERLRNAQGGDSKHSDVPFSDVPFKEIYEAFPPEVKAVFDKLKGRKW